MSLEVPKLAIKASKRVSKASKQRITDKRVSQRLHLDSRLLLTTLQLDTSSFRAASQKNRTKIEKLVYDMVQVNETLEFHDRFYEKC